MKIQVFSSTSVDWEIATSVKTEICRSSVSFFFFSLGPVPHIAFFFYPTAWNSRTGISFEIISLQFARQPWNVSLQTPHGDYFPSYFAFSAKRIVRRPTFEWMREIYGRLLRCRAPSIVHDDSTKSCFQRWLWTTTWTLLEIAVRFSRK